MNPPEITSIDTSRDPHLVVERARLDWTTWHPGDGSSYRVRILPIGGGSDHSDVVLLLNIQRQTIALQTPSVAYRMAEFGTWTKTRCKALGLPEWTWNAARELLIVLTMAARPKPLNPSVVDVHLPEAVTG